MKQWEEGSQDAAEVHINRSTLCIFSIIKHWFHSGTGKSIYRHLVHNYFHISGRFAGKYRDTLSSHKECFTNGDLNCSESESDSTSRRLSFMKMVGLGKPKRESMADPVPQGAEEQPVPKEVVEVKPREPLSGKKTQGTENAKQGHQLFSTGQLISSH